MPVAHCVLAKVKGADRKTRLCPALALWLLIALMSASGGLAADDREPLDVVLMVSGGEQRETYLDLIDRFERLHPGIRIRHREFEQETYKANIEEWLAGEDPRPDVMFWFAGHLMDEFYRKGLIRPIEPVWQERDWQNSFDPSIRDIVSYEDKAMGVPIAYYHWGIYYRKSLFERLGLEPPETWGDLIRVGHALQEEGITPFAAGTEAGWPAAAWFDYLNLRLNGPEFHEQLMRGEISYQHHRVRRVFEYWQALVADGFFMEGHRSMSWRSALPYLYRDHAAMMLIGGFVKPQFPDALMDDIGVIRFPILDPEQPVIENAPTDIFLIPAASDNVGDAERLLAFMASPEQQGWLNGRLGTTPPSLGAAVSNDPLDKSGQRILERASGYSQFFDRNTPRAFSTPAMAVFVDFMSGEVTVDEVLPQLEALREDAFGPLE